VAQAQSLSLKVEAKALEVVTVTTDKLMEESMKRAPVDEGMLEASHEREVTQGETADETVGYVYIPSNAPASDYAMYMHENEYNLGERSQRKQDDNPNVIVGRKYLERALNDNVKAFGLYIVKKFRELINYGH
jgi:hypothetical protein